MILTGRNVKGKMLLKLSFGVAALLLIVNGCDNGIIGTGQKPSPTKVGIAQKGPFVIGSNVSIIKRPGPEYLETANEQVQTIDGFGTFDFTFEVDTLYEISVTGKHLNEIDGTTSSAPITLRSTYYHDAGSSPYVSINILTHLISSRINQLVSNNMHPRDATTQASKELLQGFKQVIFAEHLIDYNFNNMTVYNYKYSDRQANALLLFISSSFYQQSMMFANSASLSEVIDYLATDLEIDGKIEGAEPGSGNVSYISSLDFAAHLLNPDEITSNLIDYSIQMTGEAIPVPDISFLLDNDKDTIANDIDLDDDGDGFPDSTDTNPYDFEIIANAQTYMTLINASIDINLQFSQAEDHLLPYTNVGYSAAKYGVVSGAYPNIVYTPNPGFTGSDSFQYWVSCAGCSTVPVLYKSQSATITINVQ